MTDESEIKTLHYKRGHIKAQLTLFSKFLEQLDSTKFTNYQANNLQQRLDRINPLFDEFLNIQLQLELIDPEKEKDANELELFQNAYFDLSARATEIISEFNAEQLSNASNADQQELNSTHSSQISSRRVTNVKLPRIDLPTFDGTFTLWRQFSDSFTAMIHNNSELSDCQKLCYLRASLKGEAANMLRSLETTEENYSIAWNSLQERYNNKRRIINNHVTALLNLEQLTKESHIKLRQFIDNVQNNIQCLKALGQSVEYWDAIILPIIINKLDPKTIREWETQLNTESSNDNMPKYDDFIKFLNKRQNILETIGSRSGIQEVAENKKTKTYSTVNISCTNCGGKHLIQACQTFLKLNAAQRAERAKSLKICINCLRKGHFVSECLSSRCKICHKKHHTTLHLESDKKLENQSDQRDTVSDVSESRDAQPMTTNLSSLVNNPENNQTLLATALVNVVNSYGESRTLRALLDSASQSNFISERATKLLNLELHETAMSISGITQNLSALSHQTKLTFGSKHNNFKAEIHCYVLPKIASSLPNVNINISHFEIPPNVRLADPTFNLSKEVDLLLGVDIFWSLLCIGQIKCQNGVLLQKTKLGWIVSGSFSAPKQNHVTSYLTLNTLHDQLQQFWKIDEFVTKKPYLTPAEEYCETLFKTTTTRDLNGKFIVRIPVKPNINDLGDSSEVARSRFLSLERKFERDDAYKNSYVSCINDYKIQNHVALSNEITEISFLLPHHAVIKETSETTKVRVVFDGSCKVDNGLPINQLQYAGPTIQDDLFSIITRFRTHEYVITADITQMYRQVWVHPDDTKYQRIIWRDDPDKPIEILELKTVTFGMTSAPFSAIRCVVELAHINKARYPVESKIIETDFYVDDVLTGAKSIQRLKTIKQNLINILKQGGFQLRKFKSNSAELSDYISDDQATQLVTQTNKALGVCWNPQSDQFFYSVKNQDYYTEVTKRTILSVTAQLFDPIGLLAPIVILAKILIQEIWQLNLKWDESVPANIHSKWLNFTDELRYIQQISVPRFVLVSNAVRIELHGFADSSERAYGACIYLKSIDSNNETKISLLSAKSRVAPLKTTTLPRLELLAATLLAQLLSKFKQVLNIPIDNEYYWTDSKIVLCWINSPPNKWATFVANRVASIQELSSSVDWHHVKSEDNPADIISRGMLPRELVNCHLWWQGPHWLVNQSYSESDPESETLSENIPELRKIKQTFSAITKIHGFPIENYSNLNRLIRIVAWCFRFKNNCVTPKGDRNQNPLSQQELNYSLMKLVKISQIAFFPSEYQNLKNGKRLNSKSSLLQLSPFLDKDDLIRVGGRLKNSQFNFNKRHPILLPKEGHLTKLIFSTEHQRLLHAGPTLLLGNIRERFWPISGRNLAKQTVRSCIKCFRFRAKNCNPIMADLPNVRVTPKPPFICVGVDYAGPLLIKDKAGRGSKLIKCYISLFVCLTTRAIHLEPVTSLSSDAFLATLRRFVARRGKPKDIYSDNGTNFQGANSELLELYRWMKSNQNSLIDRVNGEGINWHFIPPHSPHFGGIWEAGVKSTKHHLKRILGNASLSYEDLYTVLAQIEAILNSRPISPLTPDPNDLQPLTPAHFLIGRPYTSLAEPDLLDVPVNRLDRFQHLQRLAQHFWRRWSKEYITLQQQRYKWQKQEATLSKGSLVLIKDDNAPPCQWKLGRVIELHPGADEVVRVVTIKCAGSVVKRPVVKICVLPIES